MKTGRGALSKGLIRALVKRGARKSKTPPVAQKTESPREPTVCENCGAVYLRRSWRRGRKMTEVILRHADWAICPACNQVQRQEYYGRVIAHGEFSAVEREAIAHRIENVARRAAASQPERKLVSLTWNDPALEVLTTSQKLAHRIVTELRKAFGGRASYAWSDRDGSLFATWERRESQTPS